MRRPRRRPCPVPVKQAMIDWLGPIILEYYAGHGGQRAHRLRLRRVAGAPGHGGQGRASARCSSWTTTGHECPTGVDGTIWFRGATALRILRRPGQDRGQPQLRRGGQHRRRRRPRRRGRLSLPDRPQDVHDHLWRGQHLPAGDREPARHPPRRPRCRRSSGCPTRTSVRRSRPSCSRWIPPAAGPGLAQELITFCRDNLAHFKCPRTRRLRRRTAPSADGQAVQAPDP